MAAGLSGAIGGARRRHLPRLMACAGKGSLENMKNELLFHMPTFNADQVRRSKNPLHQCMIWELEETGYYDSSQFFSDLIDDNLGVLEQDEIGIVVDLRKEPAYLEKLQAGLKSAEGSKASGNCQEEALSMLELAMFFAEQGKGILWLAEKLHVAAVAVAAKISSDGGRQAACCNYYYGKFILDKFPHADTDEPYGILSTVRDNCIGKTWRLGDGGGDQKTVFAATAVELHRILLQSARAVRTANPQRADRLCRTAERRAQDAEDSQKLAEAITELGLSQLATGDLNNALKSFERALAIAQASGHADAISEGHMHVASALQRLGDYDGAVKSLSTMGTLSMKHGLRRHLARALHLLGELYLRRAKPELATPHLREAFNCFMRAMPNMDFEFDDILATVTEEEEPKLASDEALELGAQRSEGINLVHQTEEQPAYIDEAEHSRLMMAVSSGQEKMASYFRLLLQGGACNVARMKTLDWKLHSDGWWVERRRHDLIPCLCPHHRRSPLDVLRMENERLAAARDDSTSLNKLRHVTGAKHLYLPHASWRPEGDQEVDGEEEREI